MPDKNNYETRCYAEGAVPMLQGSAGRTVTGYAIVFNQPSRVLYDPFEGRYFEEVIKPEAVNDEFLSQQDIILNRDHNDTLILARWRKGQGTLQLSIDEYGLRYSAELPDTTQGNDTLESIRRGDLFGSSFRFRYARGGFRDEKVAGGRIRRTVTRFQGIYDVSVVATPAYEGTSVDARSFDYLDADEAAQVQREKNEKLLAAELATLPR